MNTNLCKVTTQERREERPHHRQETGVGNSGMALIEML